MKKLLIFLFLSAAMSAFSQNTEPAKDDHIIDGLTSVATIAGETKNAEEPQDTATAAATPQAEIPLWKQKLYYGSTPKRTAGRTAGHSPSPRR